jgi:hypothetical protein
MPSAMCYEQIAPDEWREYFCLVNPEQLVASEDDASEAAEQDLAVAFAIKSRGGSDEELASILRDRGYVSMSEFRTVKSSDSEA